MKHNTNANTMVVVDASLENYQQLIDGIRPGAKSFLLDLRSDGIKQIGELLRQHQETEVLHLLSHGSPGCLYLENSQLSLDGVEPGIASRPSLEEPDLRFSPHPATGY